MKKYSSKGDAAKAEHDIENELLFHLDMLTDEYMQSGMSSDEARQASLERFGNVERIKNECVIISERNRPVKKVLKATLIFLFLAGVLTRIAANDIYGQQIGNMLMAIAALASVLIYFRGPRFSNLAPAAENSSPLGLTDNGSSTTASCGREVSPLERAINED
jgi:hypothetical protein